MGKTKINVAGDNLEKKVKPKKEEKKVHLSGLKGGQRIKVVGAEPVIEVPQESEVSQASRAEKQRHVGKKYLTAKAKIDPKKTYLLADAAKLLKEASISKFDGSVELHLVLGKDSVNTRVELPYSTGKSRKVEVATDETVEKLKAGKLNFDVLFASPDMMPKLVPFAKLLGPKGLMPNPKNGTLIADPQKAAASVTANSIQLKTEKDAPLTHNVVAKVSQPEREIEENIKAVLKSIGEKNIKRAVVSPSMGPAIKLAI